MPPSAEQYAGVRETLEAWQPLSSHPNIAALRSAFVSSEIGGSAALYIVHDYHPGAVRTPSPGTAVLSCFQREEGFLGLAFRV